HGIGYSVTERGLEKIKEYKSLKIKETFRKDIPIIVSILSLVITILSFIYTTHKTNEVENKTEQLNLQLKVLENNLHQAAQNAK
ncbi:MAG: hypothetical protein ACYDEC_14010, partial [Bacteroidia bacterium]